ncbi:MAG: hypothetical protein GXP22_00945 [Gammaproteobacteria bacterium]|nr:hypothetical protein [Gammaproteobacteria bacterium]
MHAVIRILCLLVFAVSVVYGNVASLLLAFLILLSLYRPNKNLSWKTAWHYLRQIRWLLLTIILLYSWATPGQPLFLQYASYSPSQEGVLLGVERGISLIFLLAAVYWVLNSMSRQELLAALLFLLRVLPLSVETRTRIAVRVMLSLELLPQVRDYVSDAMQKISAAKKSRWYQASWLADVFEKLLLEMEQKEPTWIELPGQQAIPLIQWGYPLLLGVLFWMLRSYL